MRERVEHGGMELNGARTLVVGATGVLGDRLSRALHGEGAQPALAGRDAQRLDQLADELGGLPTMQFDISDGFEPEAVVERATEALGGLDLLVVAVGVAAFGPAEETTDDTVETLFAVNTTSPMAFVRAALPHLDGGGTVAALSAVLADYPTARMGAYSASKAALSAWLTALRHEQRRNGVTVLDIRPPHMDTGLVDRAIAGDPPTMPPAHDPGTIVDRIVDALRHDARELRYDAGAGEVVTTGARRSTGS